MLASINSRMMAFTTGAVIPNPSTAFSGVRVVPSLVFLPFALFRVIIVLSDLRIAVSDYPVKPV